MRKKRKRRKEKNDIEVDKADSIETTQDHQMRVHDIGAGSGISRVVDTITAALIIVELSETTILPPESQILLRVSNTIGFTTDMSVPSTARTMTIDSGAHFGPLLLRLRKPIPS